MDFAGASAAECGPGGSALTQLSKQLGTDKSLQQLAHEFLHGVGSSSTATAGPRPDAFQLGAIGRELEAIHPGQLGKPGAGDWAAEFHAVPPGALAHPYPHDPHHAEFERAFAAAQAPPHAWAAEFQTQHAAHADAAALHLDPHLSREFDQAFERAKESTTWEAEFAGQAAPSWEAEFQQQMAAEGITIDAVSTPEAMSKTAGLLLDIVEKSANPKFKQSKFVGFIEKLRDQKIVIEGNKVVEQVGPAPPAAADMAAGPKQWADDFLQEHGGVTGGPRPTSWEEDFAMASGAPAQAQVQPPPALWADEFISGPDLAARGAGANWINDFINTEQADVDGQAERDLYERDWAEQFRERAAREPQDEQDKMWAEMSKAWDEANGITGGPSAASGYAADNDPRFSNYQFTENNPYLSESYSLEFLRSPEQHSSLAESVLALEAAVQREPSNASAWRFLGQRQQENENDVSAIAALRRCVALDPTHLPAWLTLAVSYTNEGYVNEAYHALNQWIAHNPRYEQFAGVPWESRQVVASSERHAAITEKLIAAAGSLPGENLDEDVQIALGVLFNISGEYDKATDCFEAALSKRPSDYMLWNKLGATLANSFQPERAIDAYFNALQINPAYVRTRYNLAIASIQIGQHREAAEHLLGALSVQASSMAQVMHSNKGKGRAGDFDPSLIGSSQSETVWTTLRLLCDTYLQRSDLVDACDARDLEAFRAGFDF
ncbi:hypothetical protein HK105_204172 [Polyrhizophydium stewartii]|uniref:Peroxin-5 n=1 Tax=Polyrhizophydium stewartii TaxID=2732419 RepID=A0ABR4NA65_9FUNG|nr:Peroxisomal membrane signal receptor PTS1 [Polyrhizophydium stewartii]